MQTRKVNNMLLNNDRLTMKLRKKPTEALRQMRMKTQQQITHGTQRSQRCQSYLKRQERSQINKLTLHLTG